MLQAHASPLPVNRLPFNRVQFEGREIEYMAEAVSNLHISGDGPFTRRCHGFLESLLGVERALLTTSCTHALELSAILLGISPGDEVIVPSFTFVSTANAFVLRGARPVFADIDSRTLNLDPEHVESLITPRTRAIVLVHYAGVACDMDRFTALSRQHCVALVEDNAHGLFGRYRGRHLGSFGCLAAQSFHETKNVTCGEGGALLINDSSLVQRAEIVREKGTDRSRFFRGEVDKYSWVDIGSSLLPSDLLAAYLWAQFESSDLIQAKRRAVWLRYVRFLSDWAASHGVALPHVPEECDQAYHMFHLIMPSPEHREGILSHLKERGIFATFHYLPLHLSSMGRRFGGTEGACPVAERVSDCLLRLPFFNSLTAQDQERVADALFEYRF